MDKKSDGIVYAEGVWASHQQSSAGHNARDIYYNYILLSKVG